VELGKGIEAICNTSEAVGAQLKGSYRLLEQAQGAWNRLDIRAAEEALAALRAYLRRCGSKGKRR
jgi:hypothetical protein